MDVFFLTRQLTDNAARIEALVRGVSPEEASWKPDQDVWSTLELVNHLIDEEREDFRIRLDIILNHPRKPWPGIDPEGWVTERKYNQRDLEDSLRNFLSERDASLEWLSTLENPNWDAPYQAHFGPIRAGDVFASWVTHDHLHMRQLVELHRAHTAHKAEPYRLDYAGSW
jgi:hypothetical protein